MYPSTDKILKIQNTSKWLKESSNDFETVGSVVSDFKWPAGLWNYQLSIINKPVVYWMYANIPESHKLSFTLYLLNVPLMLQLAMNCFCLLFSAAENCHYVIFFIANCLCWAKMTMITVRVNQSKFLGQTA